MKTRNKSILAIALIATVTTPFAFAQTSGSVDSSINAPAANADASTNVLSPLMGDADTTPAISFDLAVNFDTTLSNLQSVTLAGRDAILNKIAADLDTTSTAVSKLRDQIKSLAGEARAGIEAAISDVDARATEVKTALAAMRSADAGEFVSARDALTSSLKAYADASAKLDAAVDLASGA